MKIRHVVIAITIGLLAFVSSLIWGTKEGGNLTSNEPQTREIYYPVSRYSERLTFRTFGQKVSAADKPECGFPFTGIHNADDLEIFPYEASVPIPIYAATDGRVVFKNYVDGYGGLIVISSNLNKQDVLLNYGHINVSTAKVRVGEEVVAGQEIANLGEGCSSETDGERKHLHFAIHKGTTLDLKGYLQTKDELENWLNPKDTLKNLGARSN